MGTTERKTWLEFVAERRAAGKPRPHRLEWYGECYWRLFCEERDKQINEATKHGANRDHISELEQTLYTSLLHEVETVAVESARDIKRSEWPPQIRESERKVFHRVENLDGPIPLTSIAELRVWIDEVIRDLGMDLDIAEDFGTSEWESEQERARRKYKQAIRQAYAWYSHFTGKPLERPTAVKSFDEFEAAMSSLAVAVNQELAALDETKARESKGNEESVQVLPVENEPVEIPGPISDLLDDDVVTEQSTLILTILARNRRRMRNKELYDELSRLKAQMGIEQSKFSSFTRALGRLADDVQKSNRKRKVPDSQRIRIHRSGGNTEIVYPQSLLSSHHDGTREGHG